MCRIDNIIYLTFYILILVSRDSQKETIRKDSNQRKTTEMKDPIGRKDSTRKVTIVAP